MIIQVKEVTETVVYLTFEEQKYRFCENENSPLFGIYVYNPNSFGWEKVLLIVTQLKITSLVLNYYSSKKQ